MLFLAMRHAKHPGINRKNGQYSGETLVFPGTNLRISIYDKKRKMRARCEHNAMRIEVQLSGAALEKRLGNAQGRVEKLDFGLTWEAYRQVLSEFPTTPVPVANGNGSIVEFLAHVEATSPEHDYLEKYILIKGLCARKAQKMRRDVGNCMPRQLNFSLIDLLPENAPPQAVIVSKPENEEMARKIHDQLRA